MTANSAILLILLAGLVNGSFVVPMKYMPAIPKDKVWFLHSIIGVLIVPWVLLYFIDPQAIFLYRELPALSLGVLAFGGVAFGFGQVCFAYAIERIGMALSFAINLGIGVVIGSMFVVFRKHEFFTVQGVIVSAAVLLIILSLVLSYFGHKHEHLTKSAGASKHSVHYHIGWLLAAIAGVFSGLQNITFVVTAFNGMKGLSQLNPFWVWPPFLLMASLPMIISFMYRLRVNSRFQSAKKQRRVGVKELVLVSVMGLCYTGSLALYSTGMLLLGSEGHALGWPTLMVAIILMSQMWGWFYDRADGKLIRVGYRLFSVGLLVAAILFLAFG